MSNKKRIKAKINSLQEKEQIKRFRLAVQIASYIIQKAIDYKRALRMPFPAGGIIAAINKIETEKVIDSNGGEKVIPKFDRKNLSSDIKTNTTINSIGIEKSSGDKTYIDNVKVDLTANQTIKLSNL